MGVYGNIHGAFNGLGKPSIKLEFEDNESLVAFSKKMQDDGNEEPVAWNEERQEFEPIEGYGDKYIVTDLRKRAKKEPGDVAANKNLKFEKQKDFFIAQVEELIANYDYERKNNNIPTAPAVEELKTHVNNYYLFANKTPQYLFMSVDEYNNNLDKWKKVLVNDVSNIARYVSYYDKIKPKGLNTGLGAPGDTYIITDTRTRARKDLEDTAALKKYDIRKFSGKELRKMQTDDPLLYEQIKSDINTPTTAQQTLPISTSPLTRQYNVIKQKYPDAVLLFNVGSYYEAFGDDAKKIADVLGISLTKRAGQYLAGFKVRDLEKNLKKLIKAGVKVAVCEQTEQALGAVNYYVKAYYPGLGKVVNNALYNNLDILDYRGMRPSYKQLPSYDAFFAPPANKNTLKGFGLADTKKLIADICRNHYKECAAIAKHLKAETKLQSAFNLWHWLHHNIRYEYDREGREEVRTPSRTWADRHRGVDCDCLSVFVWCVLKCMGYNPAFELAAFRNKPAYSHIYINLDGIVVDRVWYVFNSRPPFITKTELFKVGMLDNLGQLF